MMHPLSNQSVPYLGPDTTYENHRKSRMGDIITDYLSDDKVDARRCYEEMLSQVDEVIDYHKILLDKAVKLKELMLGHRNITFFDDKKKYINSFLTEE